LATSGYGGTLPKSGRLAAHLLRLMLMLMLMLSPKKNACSPINPDLPPEN